MKFFSKLKLLKYRYYEAIVAIHILHKTTYTVGTFILKI